jgi:hypothetical protein
MPMMSLGLIRSFIDMFDDIPLNMRNFRYPVLLMMAEHEQLVCNKTSQKMLDLAGSTIKDKVLYKGAYHELQKEPLIKDQLVAKVVTFTQRVLCTNGSKPFGKLNEGSLRHGTLPIRFQKRTPLLKKLLWVLAYAVIGLILVKKWLPPWRYNAIRTILVWPTLILYRMLIGKLPEKF